MDAEITEYKARLRRYEGDDSVAKDPEEGAAEKPKEEVMDAGCETTAEQVPAEGVQAVEKADEKDSDHA